jgi:hypothetical protein
VKNTLLGEKNSSWHYAGNVHWRSLMLDFLAVQILLVSFAICLLGVAVKDAYKFLTRPRRFIDVFVTQYAVTSRLRELAEELKELFEEEVNLYREVLSYEDRELKGAEIKDEINQAKREFWDNVLLARELGFFVPGTIEEALAGQYDTSSEEED